MNFNSKVTMQVEPLSRALEPYLRAKLDGKAKPIGSLGRLEEIALQIGLIQKTVVPVLSNPTILIYAADHGIAEEGVSAYPQDVTWQMVHTFLNDNAAINILCKQHGIALRVVDAGVNYPFTTGFDKLIVNKIGNATQNFLHGPAMTNTQVEQCLRSSATIVKGLHARGCNILGFGEMGIGNTTSASALMYAITMIPLQACVGRGTGINDTQWQHKQDVIARAFQRHGKPASAHEALALYGGFEIAQMVGGMLQAAALNMVVLVDGFISTVAYLLAQSINPHIKEYSIVCHQSAEPCHAILLEYLDVKPLLQLNMRLGEGTGIAMALPILHSSVQLLNEMASFESVNLSQKG